MEKEPRARNPVGGFGFLRGKRGSSFKRDRAILDRGERFYDVIETVPQIPKEPGTFSRLRRALGISNDLGSWLMYGGALVLFIWGVLKSLGIINTPFVIQMLPYAGSFVIVAGAVARFSRMFERMDGFGRELYEVKAETKEMRRDIQELDKDVHSLKQDIGNIKEDVRFVKSKLHLA